MRMNLTIEESKLRVCRERNKAVLSSNSELFELLDLFWTVIPSFLILVTVWKILMI